MLAGMIRQGGQATLAASAALFAALVLSACGSETTTESSATDTGSSTSPSAEPSASTSPSVEPSSSPKPPPPGTPECSEVWRDGARLPRFYGGCAEGDTYVRRDAMACSSGQRLARYADRYYGVLGGTVREAKGDLDDDRDYRASVRRCRA